LDAVTRFVQHSTAVAAASLIEALCPPELTKLVITNAKLSSILRKLQDSWLSGDPATDACAKVIFEKLQTSTCTADGSKKVKPLGRKIRIQRLHRHHRKLASVVPRNPSAWLQKKKQKINQLQAKCKQPRLGRAGDQTISGQVSGQEGQKIKRIQVKRAKSQIGRTEDQTVSHQASGQEAQKVKLLNQKPQEGLNGGNTEASGAKKLLDKQLGIVKRSPTKKSTPYVTAEDSPEMKRRRLRTKQPSTPRTSSSSAMEVEQSGQAGGSAPKREEPSAGQGAINGLRAQSVIPVAEEECSPQKVRKWRLKSDAW